MIYIYIHITWFSPKKWGEIPTIICSSSHRPGRQISVFHRPGSARTAGASRRRHETLSHGASDALCGCWEAAEAVVLGEENHEKP